MDDDAILGAAIFLRDDDILSDHEELTSEISGLGGIECRIGETLTRSVSSDEIFDRGQAFLRARQYREFDRLSGN